MTAREIARSAAGYPAPDHEAIAQYLAIQAQKLEAGRRNARVAA